MKRWLPHHVSMFKDRHGKKRYRFRRKGYATYYFKHLPGTEEFLAELRACEDGVASPKIAVTSQAAPGTFDDLLERYYRSADFLDVAERTRMVYSNVLERWRARERKGKRYGEAPVRHLQARHVEEMIAEVLPARTAANMLRKRLSAVMKCSALSLLDGNSGNSGGGPRHTAMTTTIAAIHTPTHNRGR